MPGMNLTRDEAAQRAAHVSVESYDVTLDVTTGPEVFRSQTVVRFASSTPGASTFIDLIARDVLEVELNGRALDPAGVVADSRIALDDLQAENVLRVVADCRYMNTGEGLHRFVDPVDKEVYLYSQFEVADSRRVFAVFEQPDLKAEFTFAVTAQNHWTVVSNQATPEPEQLPEGKAVWRFAATPRISSYITAIVAGPYHVERSELTSADGRVIPLGVFCRHSLREHLDADNIVEITKQGFEYFERLFDLPYPFDKYDQLFVPEFNAGAMENAGAVTFVETYVFRSKVPQAVIERRALTVLHELAHMWFGDLVTMRWWDDLWLNESFAEWASTSAQAENTRWPWAWTTFGVAEKSWAYRQDQLPTTHPIVADIRDLEDVEVNFDGITYAKGASVLKQLVAYVGEDEFVQGLRRYFKAHAWGNTELADLLRELEVTSGRDLRGWSAQWLQRAGVNTLVPEVAVDDEGRYVSVAVTQTAPVAHAVLRPHRLAIGCYDLVDGRLQRTDRIETDVVGDRTEIPELVGRKQPDLLLVNDDDLAYAKIRLDQRSFETAVAHLDRFGDSMPRSLVLGAAWDMTRDAESPARQFVELALKAIATETDSTVLRLLLAQTTTTAKLYVSPEHRPDVLSQVSSSLLDLARAAEPSSDRQLQLALAFAATSTTDEHAAVIRGLLDGSGELEGLSIDADMRWALLTSLVAAGAAGEDDIEAELDRDSTANGQRAAAFARAAVPTSEAKDAAWRSVVDEGELPNAVQESIIGGFARVHEPELLRPYLERYFAAIEQVWATRTNEIAQQIVLGLYPTVLADESLVEASDAWLEANPQAVPAMRRLVTENRDGIARALRAQARDHSA
ncbi:aminopeptidase N [Angustibacter luteus]|uniref:Aminopeptidase N n=1 Tax=Angustibacter luteus TaxID=658456 RepID=A0ABW1JJZ9_9ACTN